MMEFTERLCHLFAAANERLDELGEHVHECRMRRLERLTTLRRLNAGEAT